VPPTHPSVAFQQHLVEKIATNVRFCLTKWGRGRGQTNPLILKEKPPDRGLVKCLILLGKRGINPLSLKI